MVIFSIFFGGFAKISSDGLPYPLFAYAALVPWTFFAQGLTQSSDSLVNSSNLIKKVFFPRLVIPMGTVFSGLVDFALAFTVLLGIMAYYHTAPTAHVLYLPLFLLLALTTSLGVGLWLSALNVKFRDVKYVLPFLTQFWLYATPVVYPSSLVPAKWRPVLALNPMVGVVEGFRWALLGTKIELGPIFAVSWVTAIIVLVSGAFYFRRMERTFADVV
jgi:lipopolysaccharide transport system permease protein